jgi:hypothetical protein
MDGEQVTVISNATGGAGPLTYSYNGTWPGYPCNSSGHGVLTCTANNDGNASVEVIATDQEGATVSQWLSYSEQAQPVQEDSWSLPSWDTVKDDLTIIGKIVGVILVGLLLLAGLGSYLRKRDEEKTSREPYEEEFTTCHSGTVVDYEDTESASSDDVPSIPSASAFEGGRTTTKSSSTRQLPPRDSRGRFARSSLDKRSHSGATPTKKSGHKGNRRPHR